MGGCATLLEGVDGKGHPWFAQTWTPVLWCLVSGVPMTCVIAPVLVAMLSVSSRAALFTVHQVAEGCTGLKVYGGIFRCHFFFFSSLEFPKTGLFCLVVVVVVVFASLHIL